MKGKRTRSIPLKARALPPNEKKNGIHAKLGESLASEGTTLAKTERRSERFPAGPLV